MHSIKGEGAGCGGLRLRRRTAPGKYMPELRLCTMLALAIGAQMACESIIGCASDNAGQQTTQSKAQK